MELLKALTPGSLVGLLVGIGMVNWVDPGTAAGAGLLLFLCAAIGALVGWMVSSGKGKKEE
jgi:hypothetical protein